MCLIETKDAHINTYTVKQLQISCSNSISVAHSKDRDLCGLRISVQLTNITDNIQRCAVL